MGNGCRQQRSHHRCNDGIRQHRSPQQSPCRHVPGRVRSATTMAALSDRCPSATFSGKTYRVEMQRRVRTTARGVGHRWFLTRRPDGREQLARAPADKMSTGSDRPSRWWYVAVVPGRREPVVVYTDADAGRSLAPCHQCARGLRGAGQHRRCPGRAIRFHRTVPRWGGPTRSNASHPQFVVMMQSRVTDAVVVPTVERVLVGNCPHRTWRGPRTIL